MAKLGYRIAPIDPKRKGVDWRSGSADASSAVQSMLLDSAAAKRARRAAKLGPNTPPRRDRTPKPGQPDVGCATAAQLARSDRRALARYGRPASRRQIAGRSRRVQRRQRITGRGIPYLVSTLALPAFLHERDDLAARAKLRNKAKKARQLARVSR